MVGIKKNQKICQHRFLTTPILIYVSLIIYCSKLGYFWSFVYFNLLIFPDIYDLLSKNIEFLVQHTKVTIRNWVTSCVLTHDFFLDGHAVRGCGSFLRFQVATTLLSFQTFLLLVVWWCLFSIFTPAGVSL